MAPQVKHAAVFDDSAQQGARELWPIGRAAMSDESPEVAEGLPLDGIFGECDEAVRVGLKRGRHQHDTRPLPRKIERAQFDAAKAEVAGSLGHFQMPVRVFSFRRAKHDAWRPGGVFDPRFGTEDLLARLLVCRSSENDVFEGM